MTTHIEIDLDSFEKVRDALRSINEAEHMDSASPRDLWIKINGVEYKLEMMRVREIDPSALQPITRWHQ